MTDCEYSEINGRINGLLNKLRQGNVSNFELTHWFPDPWTCDGFDRMIQMSWDGKDILVSEHHCRDQFDGKDDDILLDISPIQTRNGKDLVNYSISRSPLETRDRFLFAFERKIQEMIGNG
jgi:hypothetical protein